MNDQILEDALRLFAPAQPAPIVGAYQQEQAAILSNFQRLKQQRLAREEKPLTP
jgi:hypothetical protein